jgi:hypothetical protein
MISLIFMFHLMSYGLLFTGIRASVLPGPCRAMVT